MTMLLTAEPSLDVRLAQRQRPLGRPVMYHTWQELLFLHWLMDPDLVQAMLPPGLTVDTCEGDAWVGIVPFFMRNIRPWWSPPVPGISSFQEVNLRTYAVDEQGIPGVWFLSLDADTRVGTWWGRTLYRLPYFYSHMSHEWNRSTGQVRYASHRSGSSERLASHFDYLPCGEPRTAEPGTLEFFLIERYVLFADAGRSRIAAGRVHHPPYVFSDAEVTANDALFELNGLPRPNRPADHAVVSRGVDVEVFALQSCSHAHSL